MTVSRVGGGLAASYSGEAIEGVDEQPILDLDDRQLAGPIHKIAPGIVQLCDPAHDRHDRPDFDPSFQRQPAADTQRHATAE